MPVLNLNHTAGPITFGTGIVWTASNSESGQFGIGDLGPINPSFAFGINGIWVSIGSWAAFTNLDQSMTFTFSQGPERGVGGFFNYARSVVVSTFFTISAFDSTNNLIESHDISFLTGFDSINTGFFFGIEDATADIASFQVSGDFVAVTDFAIDDGRSRSPRDKEGMTSFSAGRGAKAGMGSRSTTHPAVSAVLWWRGSPP
jgi:hypothetical protein